MSRNCFWNDPHYYNSNTRIEIEICAIGKGSFGLGYRNDYKNEIVIDWTHRFFRRSARLGLWDKGQAQGTGIIFFARSLNHFHIVKKEEIQRVVDST